MVELILKKTIILPKAHYSVNAISIKMLRAFFTKTEKNIWNQKIFTNPLIASTILNKKNNARRITIPNFKIYYRAILIKQYDNGTQQTCGQVEQNRRPKHEHMENSRLKAVLNMINISIPDMTIL